ncbi:MurR/RpiR family transcriptional regulator [Bacillaceae bacterium S4-13-58]
MEQKLECLPMIRYHYKNFSDKERTIADYFLEHPEKVIHSTITQLAEDLNVAEATVYRFCKRIGFSGFQAMKISLASEIVEPIKDIHGTINENDSEIQIAEKVLKYNIKTLEDTSKTLDHKNLNLAVKALNNAQRVEFYGTGGSGIVALDAHHKFMRTGIPTISYSDTHFQLMSASKLTDQDVAVLISHTGENKDIMEVLEVAKESGATTIGITHFAKSRFSQAVDIPLYTISEETDYRSEALASRIAQLSLIDALFVNVMIKKGDSAKDALQKIRKAISVKKL